MSIAILTVIEEASHSMGQLLMVVGVRDEVFLGATDTFATKQGAGGEAMEDLKNDILCEAGKCIPLIGGPSISSVCNTIRASSVIRSLKRKIIQ